MNLRKFIFSLSNTDPDQFKTIFTLFVGFDRFVVSSFQTTMDRAGICQFLIDAFPDMPNDLCAEIARVCKNEEV